MFLSISKLFVICNFSFKTKEATNHQIKEALDANNCTSVEFDEVKRIGHIRILGIGLKLACNGGSCGGISLKRD